MWYKLAIEQKHFNTDLLKGCFSFFVVFVCHVVVLNISYFMPVVDPYRVRNQNRSPASITSGVEAES